MTSESKQNSGPRSQFGLVRIWDEKGQLGYLSAPGRFAQEFSEACASFVTVPLTSFLALLTIAVTLFLLALFVFALENVGHWLAATQTEFTMSFYLKDAVTTAARDGLLAELKKLPQVEAAILRDKQAALSEFRRSLGDAAGLLSGLDADNPLPASIELRFKPGATTPEGFETLAQRYRASPMVEEVQYSKGLLGQLASLLALVRLGGMFAVVLMLVVTGFIIGSTIRLALYSRQEEVSIMRLVGADSAYVRTPALIEGFVHGVLGALFGLALLYVAFALLQDAVQGEQLLQLFLPQLTFLSLGGSALVLMAGVLVGLAGSYLAVRRFVDA